ncbi:MAG TPA: hypothetical protein VHJ19_06725, partial [Gammaproteobacteria bacterium]|nr:hypothetical protein [Gammaproteobacteria bacterium]
MLWYTGYWDTNQSELHRRQRPWFGLVLLLALLLGALLVIANPLRVLVQVAQLAVSPSDAVRGVPWGSIPLLVLIYPIYLVLCIGLSLDVLRRPGPSGRLMGDLARHRARPWLMATTIMQLLVSLLVASSLVWVIVQALSQDSADIFGAMSVSVDAFDLLVCVLIAIAVVLLGKAIVSYEIFTGKILPRRGFLRQWRYIVLVAAGYGGLVSFSLGFELRSIYPLLLTTVLMSVFFALFSWRSYAERERSMEQLRPFVASQRMYEHLLMRSDVPEDYSVSEEQDQTVDAMAPFHALCVDVLGARVAYLAALGPLAPLVGPPLAYPNNTPVPPLGEIASRFSSPQVMCVPLIEEHYGGALWAVPLWSERGLIGVLLLGEKWDGGLYTQEEIEIARASGERLIDTQASAVLAQRLMGLQRRRMAESQVLDRRARRTLHDDVLPRLHTAMLTLSTSQAANDGASSDALTALADVHRRISDLLHEMPVTAAPELARRGLLGALRQTVEDELSNAFDDVEWEIEAKAAENLESIPSLTAEVLYYADRL